MKQKLANRLDNGFAPLSRTVAGYLVYGLDDVNTVQHTFWLDNDGRQDANAFIFLTSGGVGHYVVDGQGCNSGIISFSNKYAVINVGSSKKAAGVTLAQSLARILSIPEDSTAGCSNTYPQCTEMMNNTVMSPLDTSSRKYWSCCSKEAFSTNIDPDGSCLLNNSK